MNKAKFFLCAALCLPLCSRAAETAQATLFCLSVRFQRGATQDGNFTMDLSTILPSINGELAPTFDSPSHFSDFVLDGVIFDQPVEGQLVLDVPSGDANQDGFADFFQSSQATSGTTSGAYDIPGVDDGTIRATWNRPAGSKDGTCVLRVTSNGFGQLGDFQHSFELLEYTGPLDYTPGASNVTGTVNLTRTGDPSSTLAGPIEFSKSPTNRFNELFLHHATWTNESAQTFNLSNDLDSFLRDLVLKTNYYGFVDFDDGDLNTADPDYLTWILSIDDPNDFNTNGVPDFSDDVLNVDFPLVLSLSLDNTNVLLSIRHGAFGGASEIQQINSLNQSNWTDVMSVIVTNDPQTVSLPLPTNATSFWRVRAL